MSKVTRKHHMHLGDTGAEMPSDAGAGECKHLIRLDQSMRSGGCGGGGVKKKASYLIA